MNVGKKFEGDVKESILKNTNYFYYRLRDGTGNFAGDKNENVRFQASNMCDCLVMTLKNLFFLELKSYSGKRIPFEGIRKSQIKDMSRIDHEKVRAFFIFNFRDENFTCALSAKEVKKYMLTSSRKSFPIDWCKENGIEIKGYKKISRYYYDMDAFFNRINCG
jgi:recombination protein U